MTDADSKKLEEKDWETLASANWLTLMVAVGPEPRKLIERLKKEVECHIKEQNWEIERLRAEKRQKQATVADLRKNLKEQDREIERLEMNLDASRKIRRYSTFVLTGDENADLQIAADQTKAEIERLQKECQRWTQLRIQHNQQYHEAVVRANENAIAKGKAEAELAEMKRYNEVLKSQRADVYKEGVEDGKSQAEKKKV